MDGCVRWFVGGSARSEGAIMLMTLSEVFDVLNERHLAYEAERVFGVLNEKAREPSHV
jgi:hypothetical protein